ncbi:Receptor-interacting serine/threonine-protein kinase 4 [Branchiostoma belcheri]|nr:Receptor-interacting serine/threonine-protein kinase 4 [Branchiostoma belcheri]
MRIGFTSNDPETIKVDELPSHSYPDLAQQPGFWIKPLPSSLASQGNVVSYTVDSSGDVHFSINGDDKGLFFSGVDVSGDMWAVIDVHGSTLAVQLVVTTLQTPISMFLYPPIPHPSTESDAASCECKVKARHIDPRSSWLRGRGGQKIHASLVLVSRYLARLGLFRDQDELTSRRKFGVVSGTSLQGTMSVRHNHMQAVLTCAAYAPYAPVRAAHVRRRYWLLRVVNPRPAHREKLSVVRAYNLRSLYDFYVTAYRPDLHVHLHLLNDYRTHVHRTRCSARTTHVKRVCFLQYIKMTRQDPKKRAAEDDRAASEEDDRRREEESDGSSHLPAQKRSRRGLSPGHNPPCVLFVRTFLGGYVCYVLKCGEGVASTHVTSTVAQGFRTEPVLTTYGCPTFAHAFDRRQHAEARTAGCDQGLTNKKMPLAALPVCADESIASAQ